MQPPCCKRRHREGRCREPRILRDSNTKVKSARRQAFPMPCIGALPNKGLEVTAGYVRSNSDARHRSSYLTYGLAGG